MSSTHLDQPTPALKGDTAMKTPSPRRPRALIVATMLTAGIIAIVGVAPAIATPPAASTTVTTQVAAPAAKKCATGVYWMGLCAAYGFQLPTCGHARCGVLGLLQRGKTPFYRIDLWRSNRPGGFKKAKKRVKSKAKNKCRFNKRQAARAAWMLSAKGTTSSNKEAAAVDMAVNHLLCGRYKLARKKAKTRLGKAGTSAANRKAVRKRAKRLIKKAKRQAGPYKLRLTQTKHSEAAPTIVTARLASKRTGKAAKGRQVSLRIGGKTTRSVTGSGGKVTWVLDPDTSGTAVVRAKVEQNKLIVRAPKKGTSARILRAGAMRTIKKKLIIQEAASLDIAATTSTIPHPLAGTLTYNGTLAQVDGKQMTLTLRGPWSASTSTSCTTGPIAGTGTITLDKDTRTYNLPAITSQDSGYYVWQAVLESDTPATTVEGCSPAVLHNKNKPTLAKKTFRPKAKATKKAGKPLTASFRYQDGVASNTRSVTTHLWGPFDTKKAAVCTKPSSPNKKATWSLTANGKYELLKPGRQIKNPKPGWYRFHVAVSADSANLAISRCGPRFQVK